MISVCIATYNGEKYIKQQLESILSQIGNSDEVVISDDSSTDRTLEVIKSFNDSRIKIFSNQKFKSLIFNFENAIKNSKVDVIFLSDQDDLWNESKVEKMLKALEKSDMVVSDCSFIDQNGKVILESYFEAANSSNGLLKNLKRNAYFGCCMAFKRKILKKALPFPSDIPMHDIWLGLVAELYFNSTFLEEKLTLYRKHDSNVSQASNLVSTSRFQEKLKSRFNTIKYFPLLLFR